MKVDLGLQVAANALIDALTPIITSLDQNGVTTATATATAATAAADARQAVTREAFDLACAFIDADRRAGDDELWGLIVAFAPVLDADLIHETPEKLRAARVTDGKRAFLETPSPLFAKILAADVRDRTSWSTTYYEHAVALGFMAASLDSHTGRDELIAIESFRGKLLTAIRSGRIDTNDQDDQDDQDDSDDKDDPGHSGATDGRKSPAVGQGPDDAKSPDAERAAPTGANKTATQATTEAAQELPPPRPLDDLLAELDDLVGMAAVKAEVKLVANLIRVQTLRRDRGLKAFEQSHHLIFTGNPGTGKTTVARLVAQIYRTLGVVATGQLIETDRSGLVAGYVGQTATKVVEAFDRADEGLLLIDEAYALARGTDTDFGREAIDTIVKLMEDRRDRVVVIAAGYPEEMKDFIGSNPGLESRFPKTIVFPDYTSEELLEIFQKLCDEANYLPEAEAKAKIRLYLDSQPRIKGFGNGRLVRNLFESSVARQASRVVTIKDPTDVQLVVMMAADVPEPLPLPAGQ